MPDPVGTARNDAVGIMGGTFDPVHLAHLALARAALERLGIAQVRWIPAGQPPHRATPHATAEDRLAMVRLAIAEEPRFVLDASEAHSSGPSYTVHTLERLRHHYGPAKPLVLLMGADAFRGLPSWHRWQEILGLAHIAVATRPGFPLAALDAPLTDLFSRCRLHVGGDPAQGRLAGADFSQEPAGGIHPFDLVAGTVSATEARTLIAAGAPDAQLRELLPAPVLDYIRQHHLYRP
jgi:nicotinate-nucleotide adenylyltransferase